MAEKTKSRTERESFFAERIFGEHHYKTVITDGEDKTEGRGRTPEEAQKLAHDRWEKKRKDK